MMSDMSGVEAMNVLTHMGVVYTDFLDMPMPFLLHCIRAKYTHLAEAWMH